MGKELRKILIVDDEQFMRSVLCDILSRDGCYTLQVAENGESALRQIESSCPDVVLLDYSMPGMTGLEVLRLIKRNYPEVIVIMVTSQDDEKVALKLMLEGASDYVTKSSDLDKLQYKIEKSIEISDLELRLDSAENRISQLFSNSNKLLDRWKKLKSSLPDDIVTELSGNIEDFEAVFGELLATFKGKS